MSAVERFEKLVGMPLDAFQDAMARGHAGAQAVDMSGTARIRCETRGGSRRSRGGDRSIVVHAVDGFQQPGDDLLQSLLVGDLSASRSVT